LRIQRADWAAFGLTAACALVVYIFTLAPEVTLEWSGIRSTAAWYGGVADPSGYPLWTLYAWVFGHLLPFGTIAWRMALSSAVAGAFACGAIALLISSGGGRILDGMGGFQRLPENQEAWLRIACGLVAGMAIGLHRVFWSMSVIVETQSLSLALFSLVLCLLLVWAYSPNNDGLLYAAVFLYALDLNVDQYLAISAPGLILVVLFRNPQLGRDFCFVIFAFCVCLGVMPILRRLDVLPEGVQGFVWELQGLTTSFVIIAIIAGLICLITALLRRELMKNWPVVLVSALLVLFGCSLYLSMAVASMANPPSNWGYPRTVEGFIHLITRGQYEPFHPTDDLGRFARQLALYWRHTGHDLGFIVLIPAGVPFCFLRKMRAPERAWIIGLAPLFLCLSLWLIIMQNSTPDRGSAELAARFYTPSHMVIALWAGYGLCILGTVLATKLLPRVLVKGRALPA
jgi:hypothetical protein